jgi:hypothetical protein
MKFWINLLKLFALLNVNLTLFHVILTHLGEAFAILQVNITIFSVNLFHFLT